MDKYFSKHPGEEELLLFVEQEIRAEQAAQIEQHLQHCQACAQQVARIRDTIAGYQSYHEQVLKQSLSVEWPDLRAKLAALPAPLEKRRYSPWVWAAAAAALIAAVSVRFIAPAEPSMNDLLANSTAAIEEPAERNITFITGEKSFVRPAVLHGSGTPAMRHVQALFIEARYSWENPLSTRSFQTWRAGLQHKTDHVTVVRAGDVRSYRLRTTTEAGILRSVALTLNGENLHPVNGDFQFANEQVKLSEGGQVLVPEVKPVVTETPATPEDELRVMAALNAAGAGEEALAVDLDPSKTQVIVRGRGMSETRLSEIRRALASVPRVVFLAEKGSTPGAQPQQPRVTANEGAPPAFRRELEARAGGARQLQEIVDRDLEASSQVLLHAHALDTLSQKFPPEVAARFSTDGLATLQHLQQKHVEAVIQQTRLLKTDLDVLLPPLEAAEGRPLNMEGNLPQTAQALDRLLNRLLAGNFSEGEIEPMRRQITTLLAKLEQLDQ